MEKGGPTALVMESNPYWQEMLTKMHMKKPTKLLIRKPPIKLPMKSLTKWLTRLPMLLLKKLLMKLPMPNRNMSISMKRLITELTMLNSTMITRWLTISLNTVIIISDQSTKHPIILISMSLIMILKRIVIIMNEVTMLTMVQDMCMVMSLVTIMTDITTMMSIMKTIMDMLDLLMSIMVIIMKRSIQDIM